MSVRNLGFLSRIFCLAQVEATILAADLQVSQQVLISSSAQVWSRAPGHETVHVPAGLTARCSAWMRLLFCVLYSLPFAVQQLL